MSDKVNKPPPRCKAILLCDHVIHDARTRQTSLINLFDFFGLPKFPARSRPFYLFVQMVEGIGSYELVAEIRDLSNDTVISRFPGMKVEFPQRATRINVDIGPLGIQLPHDGPYEVVVLADDQEIDRRRFDARLIKRPPPRRPEPPPE